MHPLTIFVIEDQASGRMLARLAAEILAEQLGRELNVLFAEHGAEAANLLREPPPIDLVLLDIHMPTAAFDGRLMVSLIREKLPGVPILAYTGDRTDKMAEDLQELGLWPPVLKPIDEDLLAERMAKALREPILSQALPLQDVWADHMLEVAPIVEQRTSPRRLRLALLARDHLVRLGLERLLTDASKELPLDLLVANGQRDAVLVSVQQGVVDLLVAAPDALADAQAIAGTFGTPVIVYARVAEAAAMLDEPFSLVVGPVEHPELAAAIEETLQGRAYRNPYLVALLRLTARHREIILRLRRGETTSHIANALAVSDDRVRHILGDIYDRLELPRNRAALNDWMQKAPLHLFEF